MAGENKYGTVDYSPKRPSAEELKRREPTLRVRRFSEMGPLEPNDLKWIEECAKGLSGRTMDHLQHLVDHVLNPLLKGESVSIDVSDPQTRSYDEWVVERLRNWMESTLIWTEGARVDAAKNRVRRTTIRAHREKSMSNPVFEE